MKQKSFEEVTDRVFSLMATSSFHKDVIGTIQQAISSRELDDELEKLGYVKVREVKTIDGEFDCLFYEDENGEGVIEGKKVKRINGGDVSVAKKKELWEVISKIQLTDRDEECFTLSDSHSKEIADAILEHFTVNESEGK